MILTYRGKTPQIGQHVFIAPTAVLIGDVTIADNASIWYGTVIRGDLAPITIGENTNIQDNCTIHVDEGFPAIIGANVTVGHQAMVHGCTVEANTLIGISAVVLNRAVVKSGSVVAAGSIVREGQVVGPNHLVAGIPATLKRELSEPEAALLGKPVQDYLEMSVFHREMLAGNK